MNFKTKLLSFMSEEAYKPLSFHELCSIFDTEKDMKKELLNSLNELEDEGKIICTRTERYGIPERMNLVVGIIEGNQKGYAFLRPNKKEIPDIFVSPTDMNGAMHGDRVIARLMKPSIGLKSSEGKVIRILERVNKFIIGTFQRSKSFGFVVPDEKRIAHDIFIAKSDFNNAKDDQKVVVKITEWPEKRKNPEGEIIEIVGDTDDTSTHIKSILKKHRVRQEFPANVIDEAEKIEIEIYEEEISKRVDLRQLKIITIDGADAKDLDDAVYVEKISDDKYKLGVHIADVTNYVKENSKLDKEAVKRGTSIYLADRVIPMLPKKLSNGVCSLSPNEDKLTLSVEMIIDSKGKVIQYDIFESIIKSYARMTYTDVSNILENNDEQLIEKYKEIVPMFRLMEELSLVLRDRRERRGCIDFEFDEAKLELDENGKVKEIKKYERRISNKIIEEFMLICNETIAENMYWSNIPFVYRIHEDPEIEKISEFNKFIYNFGYIIKGNQELHPKELQNLLKKVKGKKEETVINTMMLRSLKKAIYSSECVGHFGLAADYYCHFTSPIRRYPDLQIHRIIKAYINNKLNEKRINQLEERVAYIADKSSAMERIADEVERDTNDVKIAEFMSDKIGEEYEGIISSVTSFGVFVELDNTVEGLVHISNIIDDYYQFDSANHCLIGDRTRRTLKIGDIVKVKVAKVNIAKAEIDFVFIDEEVNKN